MKGKLIQNKYRILETLGQNSFSETFLATDNRRWASRRYIIKKLRPILGSAEAKDLKNLFQQEASVLKRLSGSNSQIPRLYEYFTIGEDFYLVREWIDGLTLQQKVEQQGRLAAAEAKEILVKVLSFLEDIHSYGIVYRQLKPSTIILRKNRRSIGSPQKCLPVPIYFGGVKESQATIASWSKYVAVANQQEYIPPEQKQGKCVCASDLYSLGLTIVYLLTGKNPAEFPVDRHTRRILWHQEIPNLDIHLVRVIRRAIDPNVKKRFTSAKEMLEALHCQPVNLSLPVIEEKPQPNRAAEVKVITFMSSMAAGVMGLTFMALNVDLAQFGNNDAERFARTEEIEALSTNNLVIPTSSTLQTKIPQPVYEIPAFPLGISKQDLTDKLGEPSINNRGYWQNSRALMYEDFVPQKITLGYLTDANTTNVRQAEISFTGSVDLLTIKREARNLLQDNYSLEIENYIEEVYLKQSDRHEFAMGNLEGVVQRNPDEYIYLAIWDSKFH